MSIYQEHTPLNSIRIQLYGLGGSRYRQMRDNLLTVVREIPYSESIEIEEISDIDQIIQSGIVTIPAIKIEGQVLEKKGEESFSLQTLKSFFKSLQKEK